VVLVVTLTLFRAKYPLAIVNALLDAFGLDMGFGYDIGCGFGKTVSSSPLGAKAAELNMKTLVGLFHGDAHNRLCQLSFLATYVPGMGLEDLEGCERFFFQNQTLWPGPPVIQASSTNGSQLPLILHTPMFMTPTQT
jgi:hypothetical protein